MTRPEAEVRVRRDGLSAGAADVSDVVETLADAGATISSLFGNEDRLRAAADEAAQTGEPLPDLSVFYRVVGDDLNELAARLRDHNAVDAAFVVPPAELPQDEALNTMLPKDAEPPAVTPDFGASQAYLDAAPGGIDARHAWTRRGGQGANVNIIDIEGAWRFSHEDLTQNQGGVIGGVESTDLVWRNHGTAVIGEISGDANGLGITGICPQANIRAISIFDASNNDDSAKAIRQAADALRPGDIILIELHRPGPEHPGGNTQAGYIPVEWWPHDWAAIRYATGRGVIVVEAAGNGGVDLDRAIYDTPDDGFPSDWSNPFRRGTRDSRAILVGAGAPPPGTHGNNHGADRSRLSFSNWGAAVDVQGWGEEVTTAGYGDLQGGFNEDLWYTESFSGTSSASPIVVGALGCLQGFARAFPMPILAPQEARSLLRRTGSAQQDAPGRPATQRIGRRPDLRAAIARMQSDAKQEKDGKDSKELTKDKEHHKELAKEKEQGKEKESKDAKEKESKDFKDKEAKDSKEGKDKEKDTKEAKEQTKERKDGKDLAKEKELRKELTKEKDQGKDKDGKDAKDKDTKEGKDKEKETKEGKDSKEKDTKEGKEKEKDTKDRKDGKDAAKDKELNKELTKEKDADLGEVDLALIAERVAALEEQLGRLSHFIGSELRPDLGSSALREEDDA